MARLFVGTSGWAYPQWKGSFYPSGTKADDMLAFYGSQFNSVEINNSFYRVPDPGAFDKWCAAVPEDFQFALKAPRQITHMRRLQDAEGPILRLMERVTRLGQRRGPILVQLPDDMRLDVERLAGFLEFMKAFKLRLALEFRHESWLAQEAYTVLAHYDSALCLTETDEGTTPLKPASSFAYLRLRKTEYSPEDLQSWREQIDELLARGADVYCYFRHEDTGTGPAFARRLLGT